MTRMKDRMERLVVLPFSFGCVSQASVAVVEERPTRRSRSVKSPSSGYEEDDEDEDSLSSESMKHSSSRFLTIPKPNLSTTGVKFNKLVKGFKSLSQLFVYEDEMEELGMEIGCPTDVKHVTHIGWDATSTTSSSITTGTKPTTNLSMNNDNPLMGLSWHDLFSPSDFFSAQPPPGNNHAFETAVPHHEIQHFAKSSSSSS